jgi:CRISPR/Cas system-associated protein Cas10 (large subunit of type III CRISPR-Cas system)
MFGWSHLESTAGDAVKPFFQPLKHVGTTVEAKAAIWIFIHRYTVAQALEVVRAEEEEEEEEEEDYL